MSLNLVTAWPVAIVAVSDRRVSEFVSKRISTNRSTKMTVFGCANAHGVVVYNGIGLDDDGLTPSDWLMQLAERRLFDCDLQHVLEGVRTDLAVRLQKLRARYGPKKARHTFTFGVWHEGISALYNISNFESLDGSEKLLEGSEIVWQSELLPKPGAELRGVATGVIPPKADLKAVCETIKTKNINHILGRCIKVVRDVEYRQGKARGSVSAAAQWAVIGPKREEIWCGLDVVGGRAAQEPPNVINIQAQSPVTGTMSVRFGNAGGRMLFKDAYVYACAGNGSAVDIAHYDPIKKRPIFSEPKCGVCGTPWPASHRHCEVCLHDEHHARGKKQRRIKAGARGSRTFFGR
jgi:hypothetical protein